MADKPFFSVITACLNRANFIETAIKSVLAQKYGSLEHIIIDGGSTDGTLELLKKYPHLRVYSEPDKGVYDAFNKGIEVAKGQVISLLNSDDRWRNGFLPSIAEEFKYNPTLEVVTTNAAVYKREQNNDWKLIRDIPALPGGEHFFKLFKGGAAINAWFIHQNLFQRIGTFNTAYQISADLDFCLRAVINDGIIHALPLDVYDYLAHSNSLTLHYDYLRKTPAQFEKFLLIQNMFKNERLASYQKQFLRKRYRNNAINEIKRSVRLHDPIRLIRTVKHYIQSWVLN